MTDGVYLGEWSSQEDMAKDFSRAYGEPLHEAMLADVVLAAYWTGSYEGDALVIFRKDGKLFEVHGSHCSCFGLAGQWEPEEVDPEVLLGRLDRAGEYAYGAEGAFKDDIRKALSAAEPQ